MISGRAIVPVILIAAILWVGVTGMRSGFQPAVLYREFGMAAGEVGLHGIETSLLDASASVHRSELEAAKESKASAEQLAELRDDVLGAETILAAAYLRSGKPQKTQKCIQQARELDHENPEFLVLLSEARMELGEQHDAKMGLLRVASGDGNNARAAYLLGQLFEAEGKLDSAIAWYRRALKAEPGDVSTQTALATALDARGATEQAREQATSAVAAAVTAREKLAALQTARGVGAEVGSPPLEMLSAVLHGHSKVVLAVVASLALLFAPALLGTVRRALCVPMAYACLALRRRDTAALDLYKLLLACRPGTVAALRILAQEESQSNPTGEQALKLCERWYDACPDDPAAAETFARVASLHGRSDDKAVRACQTGYEGRAEDKVEHKIEDLSEVREASALLCEAYLEADAMDEQAIAVCETRAAHHPERRLRVVTRIADLDDIATGFAALSDRQEDCLKVIVRIAD